MLLIHKLRYLLLVAIASALQINHCVAGDTLRDTSDPKELCKKGESYRLQGRHEEAVATLGQSLKLSPSARTYLARARSWQELQKFDLAIADLNEAIRIDSKMALAYCWRGACRAEINDVNNALADFTTAISLAPDKAAIYSARATTWESLGNYQLAISDLTKAIELSPSNSSLYITRSLCWNSLGEWNKSLADLDKSIEFDPNRLDGYVLRGDIKKKIGQYASAQEDYEHAKELDHNSSMVNRAFALFLSTCPDEDFRDYPRAAKLAQDLCIATDWKDYHAVGLLAMIHTVSGNLKEASKWQARAIQIAPKERKEWVRQRFVKLQVKTSTITR